MGIPESLEKVFEGAETIKALTELLMEGGRSYQEALAEAIRRYEEAQRDHGKQT